MSISTLKLDLLAGVALLVLASGARGQPSRAEPIPFPPAADPATVAPIGGSSKVPSTAPAALAGQPAPSMVAPPASAELAAIQAAMSLPNGGERAAVLARELERWLKRDADSALAHIRIMPRGNEFSQAIVMALSGIGHADPDRALGFARGIVSMPEERSFYVMLFDRLTRESAKSALPRLDLVPEEFRGDAVRTIANAWYNSDPSSALAWAQRLSPPKERTIALESVLSTLAIQDPRRAIQLAQESLSGEEFDRTAMRAVQIQASTNPAAAAELVGLLPPGDAQTNAAMTVAHALAQQNVEAALEWIKTLPIDITRWMALNSVLSTWVQKDSNAAARYVVNMQPGQHLEFAAGHLALFLANNPPEAILWAEALASEGARDAAFVSIASTWAQRDPRAALEWAASLQSEPVRTNALTGAHANWRMRDPISAKAWLQNADLPAATKRKIEFGLR